MKEIAVLSGKGGTGKTSLAAAFAVLSGKAAMADADVDASNLSLLLSPVIRRRETFRSGVEAMVRAADCDGCGVCASRCRFNAFQRAGPGFRVDPFLCEGCGVCAAVCPRGAIDLRERIVGEWMVSDTRAGPLVHARLEPAGENSGKLTARVKSEARRVAEERGKDLLLVDGPPGTGCPAIAAMSGASLALFVAEPTVSGLHDFERAARLAAHFGIPSALVVNKWDINPCAADQLEEAALRMAVRSAGRIRYDPAVTAAQRRGKTFVEEESAAADDAQKTWRNIKEIRSRTDVPAPPHTPGLLPKWLVLRPDN